jgi:hypothetical protein
MFSAPPRKLEGAPATRLCTQDIGVLKATLYRMRYFLLDTVTPLLLESENNSRDARRGEGGDTMKKKAAKKKKK